MASTTQPSFSTIDIIGKPLDRVDGRQKVTGAAVYATDTAADALAHAVVITSTIASGTVRKIDKAVLALPGVLALITPENAPRYENGDGGTRIYGRGGGGGPALFADSPARAIPSMTPTGVEHIEDGVLVDAGIT